MPLWDRDQTECVAQEIVGEKDVRSHVSNGLLRRADQTDFFTDYTLTVQQNAALFQKSDTGRQPQGPTASTGCRSQGAHHLYFTNHTLTGKLAAFPWLGSDTVRRFRRPAVRNAFVRMVLAIFISPVALCLGIKSLLATETGSRQPLPMVPGSPLPTFFAYNNLTGRSSRCAGDRRQIERHQGVSASVHDSLSHSREADSLAHALPDAVSLLRN